VIILAYLLPGWVLRSNYKKTVTRHEP
jgi:hypothetical protein